MIWNYSSTVWFTGIVIAECTVFQLISERQLGIPECYCDAVMHCKEGAATLFLQALYEVLTSRQ